MENVLYAFMLTLLAGLSTGIGGLIAFFAKKTNTKFLSVALGFSAGVMVYISFMEIFPEAVADLSNELGPKTGTWVAIISFFVGMVIIAFIDNLIPEKENPHETRRVEDMEKGDDGAMKDSNKLLRTGLVTALAVGIHNFPEGFATFMSTIKDPSLGLSIAVAIAIHNIPEEISVSLPIYYATSSHKKALRYSFLSGFAEPLGALVGFLLLRTFLNDLAFGIVFAMIAGIMVFISFDQLLPAAREYGEHHLSIYGLVGGMAVMSISLILFI